AASATRSAGSAASTFGWSSICRGGTARRSDLSSKTCSTIITPTIATTILHSAWRGSPSARTSDGGIIVHRQSRSVPLLSMMVAAIGRRLWTVPIVWALGLMLAAAVVTGANAQVLVVLSEDWPGMREVAAELREQLGGLRDGRLTIDVVTAKRIKLDDLDIIRRSELIIAVGVEAARAVIDREKDLSRPPPTLCLLIPKLRFDAFVG